MFKELGRSIGDAVFENLGRAAGRVQERTPLPVDLLESDEAYLAVFDAPGASAGDVRVQYEDGRIEVRLDRFRSFHDDFDLRYPGRGLSLEGTVDLPEDARVAPDAAAATLRENGTLEVRVPKRETTEPIDETVEEVDEREEAGEEVDEAGDEASDEE
ncbi:Hsp20 family protein [Halomicrobium salinisoli]|uniref:Hsp20 family protein n=1 Tax=Halomicrobium salinisoli TaxID=2878391 RepID=UPI001CF0CCA6|nr:Hsp20 family protein [Halomicrobium salinisoli]